MLGMLVCGICTINKTTIIYVARFLTLSKIFPHNKFQHINAANGREQARSQSVPLLKVWGWCQFFKLGPSVEICVLCKNVCANHGWNVCLIYWNQCVQSDGMIKMGCHSDVLLFLIAVSSEGGLYWSDLLCCSSRLYTGCFVFWDTSRQTGRLSLSTALIA